jgi:hypothetical protein
MDSMHYRHCRSKQQLADDNKTIDLRVFAMTMEAHDCLWAGILDGTVPSVVSDTGATSHSFWKEDPSIQPMSAHRLSSISLMAPKQQQ